jgi:hypothetical protein
VKWGFAFDADTDNPFWPDAEHRRVEAAANGFAASRQDLCLTTDLDHARSPGIDGSEIVDHDCHARVVLNVAVLLALRNVVAADVDGVADASQLGSAAVNCSQALSQRRHAAAQMRQCAMPVALALLGTQAAHRRQTSMQARRIARASSGFS